MASFTSWQRRRVSKFCLRAHSSINDDQFERCLTVLDLGGYSTRYLGKSRKEFHA